MEEIEKVKEREVVRRITMKKSGYGLCRQSLKIRIWQQLH